MHKLTQRIREHSQKYPTAILPYLMAGDGGLEKTKQLIALYEEMDVTALEIGVPFSDPVADGPVIQAAGIRAMDQGVHLEMVLDWLTTLPTPRVPRILMCYCNPIFHMGIERFYQGAANAQIAAIILPDLPLEEMEDFLPYAARHNIPLIPLASPKTSPTRLQKILQKTDGFIYAVTVSGVTGTRDSLPVELTNRLAELKTSGTLPVIAGFGIHSVDQVKELTPYCDGFIVGSKFVQLAHENAWDEIRSFVDQIRGQ